MNKRYNINNNAPSSLYNRSFVKTLIKGIINNVKSNEAGKSFVKRAVSFNGIGFINDISEIKTSQSRNRF